MRNTLGAISVALALACSPAIADPDTAARLSNQVWLVKYSLPPTEHQAVSEAGKGTPALTQAVGGSVATMTRTLVGRGEERKVIEVMPPLVQALPEFAAIITEAAVNNVPDDLKNAVREAATAKAQAIGLGGLTFPPPPSNPGNGGRPPTSPN